MRIVERVCRICGAAVAREYASDGTYLGISHDEARCRDHYIADGIATLEIINRHAQ